MIKVICIDFKKTEEHYVYAKVDVDPSVSDQDIQCNVMVPDEWMQRYFGSSCDAWDVYDVTVLEDDHAARAVEGLHPDDVPMFPVERESKLEEM